MRYTLLIAPQFYVTTPQICPYLDGRRERKLFTALQGAHAGTLNDALSKQGFRRSQNVIYRPSCAGCSACMSVRIRVADFAPTRSQCRTLRRNRHLDRCARSPRATEEQYTLFRSYLDCRHADGGMADMDIFEFTAMIEETPVQSRVVEYRDTETRNLVAVCLTDVLDDGLSLVYSFFCPDLSRQSLGTYVILDHLDMAREVNLPYVYLGYWIPGCSKMNYKANFPALEGYVNGGWVPLEKANACSSQNHPLSVNSVTQQIV
ncbi:MAG: arginyltransferase [Rhodobacteraceae bacterium]|nr:arginyltransferase [Paracoccaceae bacterium]